MLYIWNYLEKCLCFRQWSYNELKIKKKKKKFLELKFLEKILVELEF